MSRGNPFPAAAVARLSDTALNTITIPTQAVQRALGFVDAYLAGDRAGGGSASGNVIAVVGEYGTGKTHLALEIIRHISRPGDAHVRHLYLDAPADTFLALYQQRFVVELSKTDVRARVGEYYADIVAASLGRSELTQEAARRLREREVDAEDVVSGLGLMESDLLRDLQERLRVVTENDAFGTALTLFLRPEFEDAVWEWLRGVPPDRVLVERGITTAIDTDTAALEAIGVFALLHGGQNRRFVLVIDELEKVLSPPHPPAADAILAFKKLLEIFTGARAFLVLCGLPDFLEALPEDARQRIGSIVRPSALGLEETRAYILDAQERAGAGRTLGPFDDDTLAYLVELAGGTARKIIKLCYHAYQNAAAAGTAVTRPMIREVAREQFELTSRDDVRAAIARVLDAGGWLFETDHAPGGRRDARADFWVPEGEDGSGCAVLLSDSVLYEQQVDGLARRAEAIRGDDTARAVLIVVNGHLADALAPRLAGTGDRPPLVYSARRFAEDFDAAVKGIMQRLERAVHEDALTALRDRVERLGRQQALVLETVTELRPALHHLENELVGQKALLVEGRELYQATLASAERSAEMIRALGDMPVPQVTEPAPAERSGRRRLRGPRPEDTPDEAAEAEEGGQDGPLPPRIAVEFDVTMGLLEKLDVLARDSERRFSEGRLVEAPRFSRDAVTALGVRAALQSAAEQFRAAAERWFAESWPTDDSSGFVGLCETYDDTYLALPVHTLPALLARRPDGSTPLQPRLRPADVEGPDSLLFSLGPRVYRALQAEIRDLPDEPRGDGA
ncbi:hypothetical protein AGRA3207_007062 [Actinomadura graeca]|uniref:AAA+ ATPase domain-containing protein n=1 Tax=Actinomadura graeca TaxID=2750812 RepID=A0ABX8R392_9ACTN|nr:hypothetical protein [Actinomadura graeca]QXJ25551.1 hypothetical protein AGRA3207_007062 [Actinomadura graeca]